MRLAEEGARQVLVDIDTAGLESVVAEIARTGGEVHAVTADVTEEAPATAAVRGAIEKFGALDILVNNVGGGRNGRIWEITPEDWDYVLQPKLHPVFFCTHHAQRR